MGGQTAELQAARGELAAGPGRRPRLITLYVGDEQVEAWLRPDGAGTRASRCPTAWSRPSTAASRSAMTSENDRGTS